MTIGLTPANIQRGGIGGEVLARFRYNLRAAAVLELWAARGIADDYSIATSRSSRIAICGCSEGWTTQSYCEPWSAH